jgi:phage tail sheath protein FI
MSETFLHGVKLLEVDTGARPIRAVPSSVIGLVGSGLSDEAAAAVNIGTANAALRYIAKPEQGATANAITIEAVNPGTNNAATSIFSNDRTSAADGLHLQQYTAHSRCCRQLRLHCQ